jgi:hypothetical protein
VESPHYAELAGQVCKTEADRRDADFFRENGYLILRGAIPEALVDRIRADVQPLFRPDVADGPRSAYRVQDGWRESSAVRELAGMPAILERLRFLYGRDAVPFQTLNFLHGSQQRAHSDAIHFSARPARFMCGAWAALEDITADNGPLFYYPGSHRLPELSYYDMGMTARTGDYRKYEDHLERLIASLSLRKESLRAKKGDVLIWSSNLMHGGEKILAAGSTRWSQVTHYFFRDCLYYTPMHSDYLSGELYHREVRDVRTGRFADQSHNGEPFSVFPTGSGRYRVYSGKRWFGPLVSGSRRGLSDLKARLKRGAKPYPG